MFFISNPFMHENIIDDLTVLFIKQKITKDVLLKILKMYKISKDELNRRIIEKIKERKPKPILKVKDFLDDKFLKDLKRKDSNIVESSIDKKYDFNSLYKTNNFLTYKTSGRFLTMEELKSKFDQYFKLMEIDYKVDNYTIECFYNAINIYITNIINKCDVLDCKAIRKKISKDKNTLNIYDI